MDGLCFHSSALISDLEWQIFIRSTQGPMAASLSEGGTVLLSGLVVAEDLGGAARRADLYPGAASFSSLWKCHQRALPENKVRVPGPSHQQQQPVSRDSFVLLEGGQHSQNQTP